VADSDTDVEKVWVEEEVLEMLEESEADAELLPVYDSVSDLLTDIVPVSVVLFDDEDVEDTETVPE
jgi:hypothetical protein